MEITQPLALLGGLSATQFMRRYWQKKPLLVRQAIAPDTDLISRNELFALAGREDVESRLIRHQPDKGWNLRHGPFARRALPPVSRDQWTLLVQGVDQLDERLHALLRRFSFVPDARVDDVMISYASDGGGVGAHFDSYDVFLLQTAGRRRWSIGRQRDLSLQKNVPLKILANFEPEETFDLEPGDMLYLPPRYAHDGIALGTDCMTCSIGLRSPAADALGADLLTRIADAVADELEDPERVAGPHYRDPSQPATETPAAVPTGLQDFAREAVRKAMAHSDVVDRALGECLSELKSNVWFEGAEQADVTRGVRLDRRSRMLYDARHLYINGESFRAGGRDATLMRQLANQRELGARELAKASDGALELLADWCEAGWLHAAG